MKIVLGLGLVAFLAACGNKPTCTFNADGMKMEGFSHDACEKMSVGYNMNK